VWLPEASDQALLLVAPWRWPNAEPLLVSPAARRPGCQVEWFVKAYRRRWGVADVTWAIKQRSHLEGFLVRSSMSIRRLLWPVAWVFYRTTCGARNAPSACGMFYRSISGRLPKDATHWFDWIALQIARLLHPKPIFDFAAG
jgi:hypothetical protein